MTLSSSAVSSAVLSVVSRTMSSPIPCEVASSYSVFMRPRVGSDRVRWSGMTRGKLWRWWISPSDRARRCSYETCRILLSRSSCTRHPTTDVSSIRARCVVFGTSPEGLPRSCLPCVIRTICPTRKGLSGNFLWYSVSALDWYNFLIESSRRASSGNIDVMLIGLRPRNRAMRERSLIDPCGTARL
jgi:hypothetical protein